MFVADYHYGTIYKFQLNSDRTGFDFSDPNVTDLVIFDRIIDASDEEIKTGAGYFHLHDDNLFARTFASVSDIAFHDNKMYVVSILDGTLFRITPVTTEILIPDWIKNNAGWWATDQIDDAAYVTSLQWLISNKIINIPSSV